jgi:kynureninase
MAHIYSFDPKEDFAIMLDQQDPLSAYRENFFIPKNTTGDELIYLCSNSLGLQPHQTQTKIQQVLNQWKDLAVQGHFSGEYPWISYYRQILPMLSRVLGTKETEVIPMGTLTANIFQLLASFYQPKAERKKILSIGGEFPSDRYALVSFLQTRGIDPSEIMLQVHPRANEYLIPEETFLNLLAEQGNEICLIFLPAVHFATGQAFDIKRLTELAHQQGCLIGFDLAHAAGNIPLNLHDWDVDFAAWCGYKYLCGGPGHGAGIYAHERHCTNPNLTHPAGWWGNDPTLRFEMHEYFQPILTAERFQVSNPAILSLSTLITPLTLYIDAGLENIWAKSQIASAYLRFLLQLSANGKYEILTPDAPHQHGNQISISVNNDPVQIANRLLEHGIVIDERPPNIIRIAAHPLYNNFWEIWKFTQIFQNIVSG